MSVKTTVRPRFPYLRKFWKPAVSAGVGGTSLAIWFEEVIAFCADMIGVIVLSLMAAVIFVFDNYVFKANNVQGNEKRTDQK